MNLVSLSAMATGLSEARARQDVAVAVVRKERDQTEAVAMQLIENLGAGSPLLPAHLGRHVNIRV